MKANVSPLKMKPAGRWRTVIRPAALAAIFVCLALSPLAALSAPNGAKFLADHILVKPKEKTPPGQLQNLHQQLGNHILRKFPRIAGWQVIEIPSTASVSNMIAIYQASGLVAAAEPDYIVNPLIYPNDPFFLNGNQWDLVNIGQQGGKARADVNATNAWDVQNTASNVVVAVIDTGIRYTHQDLAPNLWQNPQENQDGYSNDLYGINLVDNGRGNGDPWDDFGHGSHVAGIIGAAGNNGLGIAGVCWNVQLMSLKFIDSNGDGTISDAITCIDFAGSHGANIVNASWGSDTFFSAALWDAINYLRDHGIIFVAAAGNSGVNNDGNDPLFPATYSQSLDNVVAVAATDDSDNLPSWSNYGQGSVQLGAPGASIFSCWNGSDSDYRDLSGTSMAAPHVVGACALVSAHFPNLSALQIISRVVNGVDQVPNLSGVVATGGRLNLYNALTLPPVPPLPAPTRTIWVDDSLPDGAVAVSSDLTNYDGAGNVQWVEEPWNWVTNNPAPVAGAAADQSELHSGLHRQTFDYAANTLSVYSGDTLFAYVYLDPTNPPSEIMIQWSDGCWEHRAFWGENDIEWGVYGTSDRLDMGNLPPAGQWVRLEVPASALKLEGAQVRGLSLMLYNGSASWDYIGRHAAN